MSEAQQGILLFFAWLVGTGAAIVALAYARRAIRRRNRRV